MKKFQMKLSVMVAGAAGVLTCILSLSLVSDFSNAAPDGDPKYCKVSFANQANDGRTIWSQFEELTSLREPKRLQVSSSRFASATFHLYIIVKLVRRDANVVDALMKYYWGSDDQGHLYSEYSAIEGIKTGIGVYDSDDFVGTATLECRHDLEAEAVAAIAKNQNKDQINDPFIEQVRAVPAAAARAISARGR